MKQETTNDLLQPIFNIFDSSNFRFCDTMEDIGVYTFGEIFTSKGPTFSDMEFFQNRVRTEFLNLKYKLLNKDELKGECQILLFKYINENFTEISNLGDFLDKWLLQFPNEDRYIFYGTIDYYPHVKVPEKELKKVFKTLKKSFIAENALAIYNFPNISDLSEGNEESGIIDMGHNHFKPINWFENIFTNYTLFVSPFVHFFLAESREFLAERKWDNPSKSNQPIKTNFSVPELALLFRLLDNLKPELFVTTKQDLFRLVAENFTTKGKKGEAVSPQSISNAFYTADSNAIDFWKSHLSTMSTNIRKME